MSPLSIDFQSFHLNITIESFKLNRSNQLGVVSTILHSNRSSDCSQYVELVRRVLCVKTQHYEVAKEINSVVSLPNVEICQLLLNSLCLFVVRKLLFNFISQISQRVIQV